MLDCCLHAKHGKMICLVRPVRKPKFRFGFGFIIKTETEANI